MSDKTVYPHSPSALPEDGSARPGDGASAAAPPGLSKRKGPRSRQEVERERRQLQADTDREIDQIAAEFHRLLPREKAQGIAAIYARYSSRFQHTIGNQVPTLSEASLRHCFFIPRAHVFYDLAVLGCKEDLPGLYRLCGLFR